MQRTKIATIPSTRRKDQKEVAISLLNLVKDIPKKLENLGFAKPGASDLQQAKQAPKQAMCKHMVDTGGCKDEDAGAGKNQIFKFLGYNSHPKNQITVTNKALGV